MHVNSSWNRDSDRQDGKEPLDVVFLVRAKWQKLNFLSWKRSPRLCSTEQGKKGASLWSMNEDPTSWMVRWNAFDSHESEV
jgi:hypothetical protein